MTNQTADISHQPFSSAFFNAFGKAMTVASGSPWLIAALPDAELPPDQSEPVWISLTLDGSLRGEFQLEFRRGDAALLASKFLRLAVDEFGTEHSEALLKTVKSAINEFRSALEPEFGSFTVNAALASNPASERSHCARMTAADGEANRVSILMVLDPALSEALFLHSHPENAAASVVDAIKAAAGKAAPQPANLNLVMDVELNVTLRFGQRKLTLREVLDLTSGSVVELDRQVEEPVELLLDGVVIARGEAVVIDGNYGLRVTEVSRAVSAPAFH
ncbi:MAG: flagellar motor switch protein FliN [Terracidiphilus sp.]|jgi:flagellar motor switch protein FliN/FliY